MHAVSIFSTKGGPGKTTLLFLLAAAIKMIIPTARVGIMDGTSDQGAFSGEWAPEKEMNEAGIGLWRAIHTLADPVAARSAATTLPEVLRASVTPIRVIPGVPDEHAFIELINTGRDFGKAVRDFPMVVAPNASEKIGGPILSAVADHLGWDWCLMDLPGSIQDSLSKIFLPNCSTVIVPHDLRSVLNFHGFPDLMATLQAIDVPVSGFLVNQKEDSQAYREAYDMLMGMTQDPQDPSFGVPVVGEIESFLTVRKALLRVPNEERVDALDAETGLYRMAQARRLFGTTMNEATRRAVGKAIEQVESAARQIMATCGVAEGVA